MVFEPSAAPRTPVEFFAWYEQQAEWSEDHSYDSHAVCGLQLASWFLEMAQTFPPLNGPLATEEESPRLTDYSIGRSVIYAAFGWSQVEPSTELMTALARKHGVGFFNPSSMEGPVQFPDGLSFNANPPFNKASGKPWWKFW